MILREAGVETVDDPASADAVAADLRSGDVPAELLDAARAMRPEATLAIVLRGGSPDVTAAVAPLRRALQLAASPLEAAAARRDAARAERVLSRAAGPLRRVATGDRSRLAGIGAASLMRVRRAPLGWILYRRPPQAESVVEVALREAQEAIGRALRVRLLATTHSLKILADVSAGEDRWLLRIVAPPARFLLDGAIDALAGLQADGPPELVTARLAPFDAVGEAGPARWGLERHRAGAEPDEIDEALWDECLELLVALHATGASPAAVDLAEHAARLAEYGDPANARDLVALGEELGRRLDGVPVGWSHGDFWNGNLLCRSDGHLDAVVDWDWALPGQLPLLDVFDLIALGPRETRYLSPGDRLLRILLPLARGGGDDRIRRYCAARGVPADPATLEALAVAYWLERTARWLLPFDERRYVPGWVAENVDRPLAELAREAV